jgi:hypothetical protein
LSQICGIQLKKKWLKKQLTIKRIRIKMGDKIDLKDQIEKKLIKKDWW